MEEGENERLRSSWIALRERLIARRRWLYRNLAGWLVRKGYREIGLEGPPSIARMLQLPAEDRALNLARRYHRWSAVGEFVRFVKEATAKTTTSVVEIDPALTTLPCNECGVLAKGGPELILECPNGHRWDQDANAARTLLSKVIGDSGRDKFSANGICLQAQIPEKLCAVIVEVLPA